MGHTKRALGLAHGGIKLGREILLFGCSLIFFTGQFTTVPFP